jgi:hypothetical protein
VSTLLKSRRKAPIYWVLQSSRKNYALWLLLPPARQGLFKAPLNYVEPKIRLEDSRFETLRNHSWRTLALQRKPNGS